MEEAKQMVMQENDELEIDLVELFQLLLQKSLIIVLCVLIGGGAAFGGTKLLMTPRYTSSSEIYILTKTTSVTSLADIQMGAQLTADFAVLAKSRPVLENVIETLDLDYTYEELYGMVAVANESDTRILKLSVESEEPEEAKEIANALAKETAERVAYIMKSDEPTIVEDAVAPKSPSSPNTMKNTLIGAVLGGVASAAFFVIRYLLNDTVQTEEDVRKYLNLNTLAAFPYEKER